MKRPHVYAPRIATCCTPSRVGGDGVQMDEADELMQPMPKLEPVYGKETTSP